MRRLDVLRAVYSYQLSLLVNIAAAALYYFVFVLLIKSQNFGVFFVTIPTYMIYVLVLSASMLLTINFYSVRLLLPGAGRSTAEGIASAATASAGSLIGGCAACQAPIVAGFMYFLGFNALAVSGFIAYVASYQLPIFAALILLNLALIYYSVSKLSGECRLRGGRLSRR